MRNTTITTTTYSWGLLATIEKGIDCKVVLHPAHLGAVREGGTFTDEQRIKWTVKVEENGGRRFTSRGRRVRIDAAGVAKILGAA